MDSEFRWVPYEEASAALRYDDDKTALWELDARLRAGDLGGAARIREPAREV
jgi:hypothetical protein